ncbi:MAG: carboxypeptidase-like regulatory domain-containing protein, partial [Clostridiales bacterium]|nr:carboxypeptidase-like regulatory domain-containing protein [Clostridiales bacterium]
MDGYLKISAYDQSVGRPVSGARIQVFAGGAPDKMLDELTTDDSGQTLEITLPAPPIDYSLEPDQPQPYGLYDINVQARGFDDVEIKGVQILPSKVSYQDVFLYPGEPDQYEEIIIPPNTLYGVYPQKTPEDTVKELPQSSGFVVLPEPVIPEYIIVHAGVPADASAPNYWVPFKDYVKNAASSEIYSTWPAETIKANVLAIISLTLNRVFTEWYRNRGYDFTITNSTQFDQAFTYGRNIFADISLVVDEIF